MLAKEVIDVDVLLRFIKKAPSREVVQKLSPGCSCHVQNKRTSNGKPGWFICTTSNNVLGYGVSPGEAWETTRKHLLLFLSDDIRDCDIVDLFRKFELLDERYSIKGRNKGGKKFFVDNFGAFWCDKWRLIKNGRMLFDDTDIECVLLKWIEYRLPEFLRNNPPTNKYSQLILG